MARPARPLRAARRPGARPLRRKLPPGAKGAIGPRRKRPPTSRRRRWALLLALLALLVWWWWPSPAPETKPDPAELALGGKGKKPNEPPPNDKPGPETPAKDAKPKPPVKPVVRAEQKQPDVDAKALRDAIARRAQELEACNASGAPKRVHARLLLTRQGLVKSVNLSQAGQLPAEVAACVRDRVRAWTFPELTLASDVDTMVTFSLTPEAGGAPFSG